MRKEQRGRAAQCLILAAVILTVLSGPQTGAFAWYQKNHQTITRAGLGQLPRWQKELIGDSMTPMIETYCMLPDIYRSAVGDNNEELVNRYKEYVDLPLLQDLGPLHNNLDEDSEVFFYIGAKLMGSAVREIRAGRIEEAAKYIGTLLHVIEDNACPVHTVDNALLAQLLPVPAKLEPFKLHRTVEEPTFPLSIATHAPDLLGQSVIEAASKMYQRFRDNRRIGRAQAVPILQAIYRDDAESANSGRAVAARAAARLVADTVYTILVIAKTG